MLNYKAVGKNQTGVDVSQGATHKFVVFDEGESEELALPFGNVFSNPAQGNMTGSTLSAIAGIYRNPDLKERTMAAMLKQVRNVLAESPGTDDRRRAAKYCLLNPDQMAIAFMEYVASNATIQAAGGAATDMELEYVVWTEAWDKVAAALKVS